MSVQHLGWVGVLSASLLAVAGSKNLPGQIEVSAAAKDKPLSSLPSVKSGHLPGPDLLYAPPAQAPQLENVPPWKAEPILVSGAWAYRQGEFIYQDFLYDDHGAAGIQDLNDPALPNANFLFAPKEGTLTYPSDPVFAGNAADLVELRIKPLSDATAFRVTVNALKDPERTAFTVAIGDSAQSVAWPHGAGVRSPAQLFLTVHGTKAELVGVDGVIRAPAPTVQVDLVRKQFDVRVSHAAWDPGMGSIRFASGVGLWDAAAGTYLVPQSYRTATTPGGAAPSGAALFNVAFRFNEPLPNWTVMGASQTLGDAAAVAAVEDEWWREHEQADALRTGDISEFSATVDFGKLLARRDDDGGIPAKGAVTRILASHFTFGEGIDYTKFCGRFPTTCEGAFVAQLQPYVLYIPDKPQPPGGWGLTLLMHFYTGNYNDFLGSNYQIQLAERGLGSLVVTPASRGPDGDYFDIPEADTFEVWADVARHYKLDPDWAAITGYSMGGGAAYKLAARWPDLFARSMSAAAAPFAFQGSYLPPLRNIPVMTWIGAADEGATDQSEGTETDLANAGLRFTFDLFLTSDHLTILTNNDWQPVADFLGEAHVDRNPPHVTYIVDPRWDSPRAGMIADHAYWLSDMRLRNTAQGQVGQIDARSDAFGIGDSPVSGAITSYGAVVGGMHGAMPYQQQQQTWGDAPVAPVADRVVIHAVNIAHVTVDTKRARLSCNPVLQVQSDGPMQIQLDGCGTAITVGG